MDRQMVTFLLCVCVAGTLVLVPGAFDALFALVFIGMIPFTDYVIPPIVMLVSYSLLIALGLRWLFIQPVLIPDTKRREITERTIARKRVLKKTAHSTTKTTPAKRRRYQQTAKA